MKCHIIKDLLPNYTDGLTSEETSVEIKTHLNKCADCRVIYEKMAAPIAENTQSEAGDIDFMKKVNKSMSKKTRITVAVSIIIPLLCIFFTWTLFWRVPVPFDAERMTVERVKYAAIEPEAPVPPGTLVPSRVVLGAHELQEGETLSDGVELVYHGVSSIVSQFYLLDVDRGGETVRVIYYNYSDTRINILRSQSAASGKHTNTAMAKPPARTSIGGTYADEPTAVEVYYMPRFQNGWIKGYVWELSDEEYDALRHKAILVWSGVIGLD